MNCYAYKSPKKDLMYLFIPGKDDFEAVPEALLAQFGEPVYVMEFELTPERAMANADPKEVLNSLEERGFYLQMPPKEIDPILQG